MTRLGPGLKYTALGLLPPAQALSHFRELGKLKENAGVGSLSLWVISQAELLGFSNPASKCLAQALHGFIGFLQCALVAAPLLKVSCATVKRGVCLWALFSLFVDSSACAINTCRIAYHKLSALRANCTEGGKPTQPEGYRKGEANENGDCFYHSFLQLIAAQDTSDAGIGALRGKVADSLLAWFDDGSDSGREVLLDLLAEAYNQEYKASLTSANIEKSHAEAVAGKIRTMGTYDGKWANHIELQALLRIEEYQHYEFYVHKPAESKGKRFAFFNDPKMPLEKWKTSVTRVFNESIAEDARVQIHLWNDDDPQKPHYEPLWVNEVG